MDEKSDARIYARVPASLKQRIQQAADLKGLDMSAYVLSTVVADADKTIREHLLMELSLIDQTAFAKAVFDSPAPNGHLLAAAKLYKKRNVR